MAKVEITIWFSSIHAHPIKCHLPCSDKCWLSGSFLPMSITLKCLPSGVHFCSGLKKTEHEAPNRACFALSYLQREIGVCGKSGLTLSLPTNPLLQMPIFPISLPPCWPFFAQLGSERDTTMGENGLGRYSGDWWVLDTPPVCRFFSANRPWTSMLASRHILVICNVVLSEKQNAGGCKMKRLAFRSSFWLDTGK